MHEIRATLRTLRLWFQPHRRAALIALAKATALLGAVSEITWQLNARYFSRRFVELPISLAWSMLTVISIVILAQASGSVTAKIRSTRRHRESVLVRSQLRALLSEYISGEDSRAALERFARDTPGDFDACVTEGLLGMRGFAAIRLSELAAQSGLQRTWIANLKRRDEAERRSAVERLALLRDPVGTAALETALKDPSDAVVAAAIRGLLRLPFYSRREELLSAQASRPYLVRVLTACESAPEPACLQFEGDSARARCAALASAGTTGRDLLRLMSAIGEAGEAPAEALGESLAAMARGGPA